VNLTIERIDQPLPLDAGMMALANDPQRWVVTVTRPDGSTLQVFVTTEQGGARDISVHGIRPEEIL